MTGEVRLTRRRVLATTVALGTATVGGCTGGADQGAGATTRTGTTTDDLDRVTVGQVESGSGGLLLQVILGEALDRAHGLDIEPRYAVPSKVPQLVVNRAIPVGFIAPIGAANARLQGNSVSLFGPILANHTSLMVRPEAPYEGWEDLRGERVGVLPHGTGTFNHALLRLAVDGVDLESAYDLREGSPGAVHSLNGNGDVAGHVHFLPTSVRSRAQGDFREAEFLPDALRSLVGRNMHFSCLVAYQDWIDDNEDVAFRLRETFQAAAGRMNDDPRTYLERYREAAGYENEAQIDLAVGRTPAIYPTDWTAETRENLRSQLQLAREHGVLPNEAPVDVTAGLD